MKFPIPNSRGFSLVEILAALSVLVLLGVLIAQLINTASLTTRVSNRSVDAAAQARLVFDRIGQDLAEAVLRDDADLILENDSTFGGQMDFLASVASVNPSPLPPGFRNRGYSRIHYRMEKRPENGGRLCLVRGAKAVGWDDRGFMGLKNDGLRVRFSDPSYPVAVSVADYDILSPGVLKMVLGFQLYPDDQGVWLADGSTIARSQGQIVYSAPVRGSTAPDNSLVDRSRIAALVVGLVVMDLDSLQLLDETTADQLAGSFAVLLPEGSRPVGSWKESSSGLTALPSSVPLPVKQALRLYQRFYPITPYGGRAL